MNNDYVEEPIQSRCAVLRYSKLSDKQMLKRLLEICDEEGVSYADEGLEAIIFTAQGDMRQVPLLVFSCVSMYLNIFFYQAINNLQSTFQGFGHVSSNNVFKVVTH